MAYLSHHVVVVIVVVVGVDGGGGGTPPPPSGTNAQFTDPQTPCLGNNNADKRPRFLVGPHKAVSQVTVHACHVVVFLFVEDALGPTSDPEPSP